MKLTEAKRFSFTKGFYFGEKHCFRIYCQAILLKSQRSILIGSRVTNRHGPYQCKHMIKAFQSREHGREKPFWTGTQTCNGLLEQGCSLSCDKTEQTEREQDKGTMGAGIRQRGEQLNFRTRFIHISARYKRIRNVQGNTFSTTL
ncbi:hypothetical protein HMPREF1199_01187 [Hoylesella oralis CC98A]|nr:hypothetical protein HMPREF1199_01187 [Hoylesella oralis CC98A]